MGSQLVKRANNYKTKCALFQSGICRLVASFVNENTIFPVTFASDYLARYFQRINQNKNRPHNTFSLSSLDLSKMYVYSFVQQLTFAKFLPVGFPDPLI